MSTRQSRPGDSAPDFSHLQANEPEADDGEWAEPVDRPLGRTSEKRLSEPASDAASDHDDLAPRPVGDSHVFFDTDDPLSSDPDALSGETLEMAGRDVNLHSSPTTAEQIESEELPDQRGDAQDSIHLDKAAVAGKNDSTSITDYGLPTFEGFEHAPTTTGDPRGVTIADFPPATPRVDDASAAAAPSAAEAGQPQLPVDEPMRPGPNDPQQDHLAPPRTSSGQVESSQASSTGEPPAAVPAPSLRRVDPERTHGRRRLLVIVLASYASAVTLAGLWLWFHRNNARPHDLESLPDVAPLNENEFRYAPQSATMPRGHILPLGSEQQLGYIRIAPLRVTRGPVEFVHYADVSATRPATEPVLKLWLRFTNVSNDQWIAPLDPKLLFTRQYDDLGETAMANQILFPAAAKESGGSVAFVLEHPESSEWDLKGQQLGYRLKPGETLETYIPTQPGDADGLSGDLLWRVHFRKGYNPQTGHGVTTMIEVPFHSSDVRPDVAS